MSCNSTWDSKLEQPKCLDLLPNWLRGTRGGNSTQHHERTQQQLP